MAQLVFPTFTVDNEMLPSGHMRSIIREVLNVSPDANNPNDTVATVGELQVIVISTREVAAAWSMDIAQTIGLVELDEKDQMKVADMSSMRDEIQKRRDRGPNGPAS